MKLSEALAETTRIEGELMRTMELRDAVVREEHSQLKYGCKDLDPAVFAELTSQFISKKTTRVNELDADIKILIGNLLNLKNSINRRNVEVGIDLKLQKMKYLRIQLSRLMALLKSGSRFSDNGLSDDLRAALNINNKIKELEREKSKLDSEIQQLNWTTSL